MVRKIAESFDFPLLAGAILGFFALASCADDASPGRGSEADPSQTAPGDMTAGSPSSAMSTTAGTIAPPIEVGQPMLTPNAPPCGVSAPDGDGDGTPDCEDMCPADPGKAMPGGCGCGVADTDSDTDGAPDCMDACPMNPAQSAPVGTPGVVCNAGLDQPEDPNLCSVADIPDELRIDYELDDFYTRYADANGIPIIASDSPQDEALRRACLLVLDMSGVRDDVRQALITGRIRFIMMGADEKTVDTPDFAYLGDLDWRARGLGGLPAALCAEENIMCDRSTDRWRGESICVHEYAHTMAMGGYAKADRTFDSRLETAYRAATSAGLFANTYAGEQPAEYWAEGVQDWYNTNLESARPNGVHNAINTRDELRDYDPALYELLEQFLPAAPAYEDCYHYDSP